MPISPPPNVPSLPILNTASEAYKLWYSYLLHFPKLNRYTLGSKADSIFVDVLELILVAGSTSRQHKLLIVQRANIKLDLLKFFLKLLWELKVLDNSKYQQLSVPISEIGRMIGGWQKQLLKETPPNNGGE